MSLRYLVPTLGLVAFTATPAMAADVGGLNIGGYVDTILTIADGDEALTGADGDATIDFSAAAQIEVGYQIGDNVSANVELYYDEDGFDADNLEQAYVNWAINEEVALRMGKMHNWIGWEGTDAPELYRVNNSYMYAGGTLGGNGADGIWGVDVTGLGVIITPNEQFEIGLFIVDYIYFDDNGLADDQARGTDALSFGAYGTWNVEGIGYFDLDIGFGMDESVSSTGTSGDIFQLDLNGEIDAIREDNGWLFAFDINYTDYDVSAALGILALANFALPTETPMSLTGSLNYFDPDDDSTTGEDDEGIEFALALLANPTDNENFSTNVELRYISRSADDANEFGFFVEALAVIP
ncbi:MAG: hypothetical protein PF961_15725 [Planctomycetota bacterium]|nr:hypothetical protein [Planctomycetota bacterium]